MEKLNEVSVVGRVSKVEKLKYTPAGKAVLEFVLAVPQEFMEKASMGYLKVVVLGEDAETHSGEMKIGKTATVKGSLWSRTFQNRRGEKVTETKILAESLFGE